MADFSGAAQYVLDNVRYFALNFIHNIENVLNMDRITLIRLTMVVGAYMLVRPYIMKGAENAQRREHAKVYAADDKREKEARISANSLRGQVQAAEDADSEQDAQVGGSGWGATARQEQRDVLKRILEQEENMRLDAEGAQDDADIREHLVDYEEGKDGW